jgi:hypothetical protein
VVRFFTFWALSNPSAGCHSKVWEWSPNFLHGCSNFCCAFE